MYKQWQYSGLLEEKKRMYNRMGWILCSVKERGRHCLLSEGAKSISDSLICRRRRSAGIGCCHRQHYQRVCQGERDGLKRPIIEISRRGPLSLSLSNPSRSHSRGANVLAKCCGLDQTLSAPLSTHKHTRNYIAACL